MFPNFSCAPSLLVPIQSMPTASNTNYPRGEPKAILDRKMVKRGRLPTTKMLVKWKNFPE